MPNFRDLTPLLRARSIAVVGASPRGNRGQQVLRNLHRFGFAGDVTAVNPNYDDVDGVRCVPKVEDLPGGVDLVVAAVSAERTVDVLDDAGRLGVRAAVAIASGFGEGGTGQDRRGRLQAVLDRHGMVAVGPNCYGVLDLSAKVAAFSGPVVDPFTEGDVALVLQSGALSHAITDSAVGRGLGISAIVTTGNEVSATVADYVAWYAQDPGTRVIGVFLEGLRGAPAFARACRAAHAAGKPVVVLATGRSERGRHAAFAHTGAVAGSGSALAGLLRSVGAIQARDLDEFREMLLLSSLARRPAAGGAAVVSISGGGSGLMADLAEDLDIDLPALPDGVAQRIRDVLPSFGVAANPLDATGAAAENPDLLRVLLQEISVAPDVGAVCFAFNVGQGSRGQEDFYRTQARLLADFAETHQVSTVALSLTTGPVDQDMQALLAGSRVPLLSGARPALAAVAGWLRWHGTPVPHPCETPSPRTIPGQNSTVGAVACFEELTRAGVPVPRYALARTPREAGKISDRLAGRCVVKIESRDLPHKTEVGGVRTGLTTRAQIELAAQEILDRVTAAAPRAQVDGLLVQAMVDGPVLECLVGVVRDPQVGLVLSIAPGGVLVELLGQAPCLPVPVSRAQVETLIDASPLADLLSGYRGGPDFDRQALVDAVADFSRLAASYGPALAAAEINPLLVRARGQGVAAVDCLIVKEPE